MTRHVNPERFETVVIGGGQAGLSVGYYLAKRGRPFVILDAGAKVGDSWRNRWDSLLLFTPARIDGLPGMSFPAPGGSFITKDQKADYVESYAERFELPVERASRSTSCREREITSLSPPEKRASRPTTWSSR